MKRNRIHFSTLQERKEVAEMSDAERQKTTAIAESFSAPDNAAIPVTSPNKCFI